MIKIETIYVNGDEIIMYPSKKVKDSKGKVRGPIAINIQAISSETIIQWIRKNFDGIASELERAFKRPLSIDKE